VLLRFPQRLVLRESEGDGHPAPGLAALAREVPGILAGLDTLEPPRSLVHVRVDFEQDVLLVGRALVLPTPGHSLMTRLPQPRLDSVKGMRPYRQHGSRCD